MDLLQERARGERAEMILREPIVKEAFEELRKTYVDGWSYSDPSDAVFREECYHLLKALQSFKAHFESILQTGEMAATQLESLRK